MQAAGPVAGSAWLLALIPVMFTYSGWNAAAYVAEEIRDPGRNVPRALAIGTLAVVAIYVLLNLLFLYVLPVGQLAAVKGSVLDVVADRLLGPRAGDIMAVVSIVSIAASISAMVFAGPRVYYAMARDGVFFKSAARIHPRFHTPAVSIVGQSIWSGLLVLSGSADALTTYTGFSVVLFAGVAVLALFVLRLREPDAPRPVQGDRLSRRSRRSSRSPARSSSATRSTRICVVPIRHGTAWGPAAAGLIVIGLGVPLYLVFRRRS